MEDEVEVNPIADLVDQITTGDLNKAEGSFKSIIDDKIADALESQRIQVASQIFNDEEEIEGDEDIVDEVIEDEDEDIELEDEDFEFDEDEIDEILDDDDDELFDEDE